MTDSQEEVLRFLADPASYGGMDVRRFDTHASSVFLVGDRALKVKRCVTFPFLDYSTLEKRRSACAAELDVNRRFAPGVYRRIVPITREDGGKLALDGKGEPVEWAVEMRRFDETRTLDLVAERAGIDAPLADQLGRAVAAAHARALAVAAGPWIAALSCYIDQNDAALREAPELFDGGEVDALSGASRNAFARLEPLLVTRGANGLIRRCHGDLHLGNIALIDGEPVPFDAIEFNPLIASGDVLYDLAFLLMDLVERGQKQAANIVLNRYLAETRRLDDLDALAALPLFMSVRAAIRAKVTAARLARVDSASRAAVAHAARAYFRLACDLIRPVPSRLVAIGGLSGTGKSVLARALAPDIGRSPGAVLLRSDVERKALFAKAETEHLAPDAYRPEVSATIYAALRERACRAIAAGHSVIVDATFADPRERAAIGGVPGASFHGLFLVADVATRIDRVGARAGDASDADLAVARRQETYDLGKIAWDRIDASGPPAQTLALAMAALGRRAPIELA